MNPDNQMVQLEKKIIDIHPGDKNIDLVVILISYITKTKLKNDKQITQYQVGDDTGSILCNFYDDVGDKISEGDILILKGSYATIFKNHLVLYTAKPGFGSITKINEFFMTFSEYPNLSAQVYDELPAEEYDKRSRGGKGYQRMHK